MLVLRSPQAMRDFSATEHAANKRIGFVPTMGALHAGHLSLVELAKNNSDTVVASVFVNPTQFGPNEDLNRYPRDLHGDLEKLRERGVHAVFTPSPSDIYPAGFSTYVVPE